MHPKYSALFTSVNLLLGVGPLILPAPFFEAGVGLSTIWMIIIILISFNSASYIAQAMSKIYFIQYQKSQQSLISSDAGSSVVKQQQIQSSTDKNAINNPLVNIANQQEQKQAQIQAIDHNQQLQILYGVTWGKRMKIAASIMITIYIGGTCVSKCIMTSKILSQVFNGQIVIGTMQFWLGIFFLSGAVFGFRSVQKTAGLQFIIILVRFLSIVFMIGGAIYLMIVNGIKNLTPSDGGVFNFSSFTQIFSNALFCLMFHHSFPSIAASVKNSTDLNFFLKYAFIIAGSINVIIPWTAVMAFGDDLGSKSSSSLKYYNFDFQNQIPFIYYFVSFYVFLNIAAMPVYVIVIRGNILKILKPQIDSKVFSKTTLITTLIILGIVLLISFLAQNFIQIVLDFTGGIFGVVILFIIPSLQVYKARQLTFKKGHKRNYIRYLPFFIIGIGLFFMGFNLFQVIKKLI